MTRESRCYPQASRANKLCNQARPPNARYELNLPSLVTLLDISLAIEFVFGVSRSNVQLTKSVFNRIIWSMKTRYLGQSPGLVRAAWTAWLSARYDNICQTRYDNICQTQVVKALHTPDDDTKFSCDPVPSSVSWTTTATDSCTPDIRIALRWLQNWP